MPQIEEKALNVALESAEMAANFLVENMLSREVTLKEDGSPLTQLDIMSQKIIVDHIKEHFPNDSILAEESERILGSNARMWIIDPIDGTSNYSNGLPFCGINISLVSDSIPIVSITRSVFQQEHVYRIHNEPFVYYGNLFNPTKSNPCVIIDSIPADINHAKIKKIASAYYEAFTPIRSIGSAAIGILYVVLGRASAYFAPRLHIWDVAPGLHFAKGDETFKLINLDFLPWQEGDQGFGIIRTDCLSVKNIIGV